MSETITFKSVLDDLALHSVRVTEIDGLPVQLSMATEDAIARVLMARHRNGTLANLSGKDVVNVVLGRLGYGEKSVFKLRSSYGNIGVLTIWRLAESTGDATDGFRWTIDEDVRQMFGY